MWMMLGLSARYHDVDGGSSSDSSVLSSPRVDLSSPQVDLFHSLDSSLESSLTRDEILSDNAEQDGAEVCDWLSHSASRDVSCDYNSPQLNDRSRKRRPAVHTALARSTARDHFHSHKLSQSVDEYVTCSTPDLRICSRSLSETADSESMRAIESEISDSLERRRTGLRGSLALMSQVRSSFQQHFIADSKRRRRRIKQIFTADSTEPQLVSLRRFCDDYRTSCLQQNLTARRCSLDRMLSAEHESTIHRLSNVAEESGPSSAGISNVSIPPLALCGEVDGDSNENDEDPVKSTFIKSTFISSPTDVECSACDEVDCDQLSDFLGDSVGSCMTATSVISDGDNSAQCVAVEDTVDSFSTVASTALSDDEYSRALNEGDGVGAVERLIDANKEHVATTSTATSCSTAISDLLLLLDEMTCTTQTQCNTATDDLLLPGHTSDVDWLSAVDNTLISTPTSTDDLINFSQTSDELTSSLSENCLGDVLDIFMADVASGSEMNTQMSTEICGGSETVYKEAVRADSGAVLSTERCGGSETVNKEAVRADSGAVLVNDEDEETWL